MIDESLWCSTGFVVFEDLTPGPKAVSISRALCSRNSIKVVEAEQASDTDLRRGMRVLPSLVLARELYTFLIGYYNKKNVSRW